MPAVAIKTADSDTEAIAQKISDMNSAYRRFKKAMQTIAKEQRALLTHVQELLDQRKTRELLKKIH